MIIDFGNYSSISIENIDFVRVTKAKNKTETKSNEQMTNGYPILR